MDLWLITLPVLRYALQIAGNLGQAVLHEKSQWMPTMLLGSKRRGMLFGQHAMLGTLEILIEIMFDMAHIKDTQENPRDRKAKHHYFSGGLLVIGGNPCFSVTFKADVAVPHHSGLMRWATSCLQHCPE